MRALFPLVLLLPACGEELPAAPLPLTCPLPAEDPHVVDLGSSHDTIYAIMSDGSLWCWGTDLGDLCQFTFLGSPYPARGQQECLVSVSRGLTNIGFDGWGKGRAWDPGGWADTIFGDDVEEPLAGLDGIVDFRLSGGRPAALDAQGTVWQRGLFQEVSMGPEVKHPDWEKLAFSQPVAKMRIVGDNLCAILQDRTVECEGANSYGELGFAPSMDAYGSPVQLPLADVADLTGDHDLTCALTGSGEVLCAGRNSSGILGIPYVLYETETRASFEPVPDLPPADGFHVESAAACIHSSGDIWCWGGYTRPGGEFSDNAPRRESDFGDVIDVAVNNWALCVLRENREVWCAGDAYNHGFCDGGTDWALLKFESCDLPL